MWHKIKCWLGFHAWEDVEIMTVDSHKQYQICKYCGIRK